MEVKAIYSGTLSPIEVHVEPNPAHDVVMIRFANSQSNRNIEIYNASLQLMDQVSAPDKMIVIPVREWSSGIYFLKINEGNEKLMKKIIKL